MKKKICIVTGANRGIGRGIVKDLAQHGHHVILVCRDANMGGEVLKSLINTYGKESAQLVTGDLSSIKNIENLASALRKRFKYINILIHNAGVWPSKLQKTEDGLELAFMVNYLAPFYLTHHLLSLLKEGTPSRIVLVNAGLYQWGNFDPEFTPWGKDFGRIKTYMNSKLCGILFMRKIAPILENSGVIINAVHPGVIRTGLGDFQGIIGVLLKCVKRFLKPIEVGAKGPVNLALNPHIVTNGSYYDELEEKNIVEKALDDELAAKLWDISLQLCQIDKYDDIESKVD